jgi:hypothetical protein
MSVDLDGWLPVNLVSSGAEVSCDWLFAGQKEFTEPFFDDTIRMCKGFKENRRHEKLSTNLHSIISYSEQINSVLPAAFIFHVSRCGSTLLSQLLSSDKRNIVLSEVPFFDALLRLPLIHKEFQVDAIGDLLAASINIYARKTQNDQALFFIKTDSWHLHFYEIYRKLFPSIPFILLYRDPVEVIQSHRKQRGLQAIPGMLEPEIFGFEAIYKNKADFDSYMGDVLTTYFRKMIDIIKTDTNAFAFNYTEGIPTITKKIYQVLHITVEPDLEKAFAERSLFHAKHPQQIFSEEIASQNIPEYLQKAFALFHELRET